jgi:hypothetical protein
MLLRLQELYESARRQMSLTSVSNPEVRGQAQGSQQALRCSVAFFGATANSPVLHTGGNTGGEYTVYDCPRYLRKDRAVFVNDFESVPIAKMEYVEAYMP